MTEVLQCPYCDLRFSTRSELDQHKAFDHPRAEEEVRAGVDPEPEEPVVQPEEPVERTDEVVERRGFLSRLFKRS